MANKSATAPRQPLWKKAWRIIFWPFYRHFDALHRNVGELHESIIELKSSLQSLGMANEQSRLDLHDTQNQSQQQAGLIQTQQARLDEFVSQVSALDQHWQNRLAEAQKRNHESAEIFATRSEGRAARLETGLQESLQQQQKLRQTVDRLNDPVGEGFNYTAFEDRFRGSEAEIRRRQAIYLPLLRSHPRVVDLGCGRGELLELLREGGVESLGVESNPDQIARCRGKGLEVEAADFMAWLEAQPARGNGALALLQVVEHLSLRDVQMIFRQALRVLRPGGVVLIETVNPHCPEALEWFFIDPTHQRPVYPELLELMMQHAGLTGIEIRYQSPSTTAPKNKPLTARTAADFAIWGFIP